MVYKKKDSGESILKTNLWVTLFLAFNILSYLPGQKKRKERKREGGRRRGEWEQKEKRKRRRKWRRRRVLNGRKLSH